MISNKYNSAQYISFPLKKYDGPTHYISLPLNIYKELQNDGVATFEGSPEQIMFAIINLDLEIHCPALSTFVNLDIVEVYMSEETYKAFEARADEKEKSIDDLLADGIRDNIHKQMLRRLNCAQGVEPILEDSND